MPPYYHGYEGLVASYILSLLKEVVAYQGVRHEPLLGQPYRQITACLSVITVVT